MSKEGVHITGTNETHWTDKDSETTGEGEKNIHFGRENDNHREGVGILLH